MDRDDVGGDDVDRNAMRIEKDRILREILHHTEMMESALDAEDFEVFELSLDARGALIETLEGLGCPSTDRDREILSRVSEIHGRAMEKLVAFKERTGRELESIREERLGIARARRVQNQYQGFSDTGTGMDTKK